MEPQKINMNIKGLTVLPVKQIDILLFCFTTAGVAIFCVVLKILLLDVRLAGYTAGIQQM